MKETDCERESALQEWKGVELMPVVKWCLSGAKHLGYVGREFCKLGEKLRNYRLANLSLVETGERDDLRNEFCWEV